jgi:hypothetical protein
MADDNLSSYLAPFVKAMGVVGIGGGGVALKWLYDWWRAGKADETSDAERRDAERMRAIDRLDARSVQWIERLEAENHKLENEVASLHAQLRAKDDEMRAEAWRAYWLARRASQSQQIVESAHRQLGLEPPPSQPMPQMPPEQTSDDRDG